MVWIMLLAFPSFFGKIQTLSFGMQADELSNGFSLRALTEDGRGIQVFGKYTIVEFFDVEVGKWKEREWCVEGRIMRFFKPVDNMTGYLSVAFAGKWSLSRRSISFPIMRRKEKIFGIAISLGLDLPLLKLGLEEERNLMVEIEIAVGKYGNKIHSWLGTGIHYNWAFFEAAN